MENPLSVISDRKRVYDAYKRTFNSPEGQIVLKHMAKHCFVGSTTFVRGDPDLSLVNEGVRRCFLSILKMAKIDTAQVVKLLEEQYEDV